MNFIVKILESILSCLQTFPREVQPRAVVRAERKVAESERGNAARFDIGKRVEIAGGLRHFSALHQKKFSVHPIARKRNAVCGLGLRDFVRMVRADVVYASGVYIKRLS